jgi:hypothetical protein
LFGISGGFIEFQRLSDMGLIQSSIFGGQQDSAAGQAGFERVFRGFGFAGVRCWAGAQLGIRAIGSELGARRHGVLQK